MGKSIKRRLFMLIVGILTFFINGNVYAAECYKMPDNKTIIPAGYEAKCYYASDSLDSYKMIELNFTKSRIHLGFTTKVNNYNKISVIANLNFQDLVMYDESFRPDSSIGTREGETINFDGINISNDAYLKESIYDKNISGCPKSVYLVHDSKNGYRYFGFSSTTTPSVTASADTKINIYKQIAVDEGIRFTTNDDDQVDFWSESDEDLYIIKKEKCTKVENSNINIDNGGYAVPDQHATDIVTKAIASCKYTMGIVDRSKDECYKQSVTIDYINTKTPKGDGTSTNELKVETSFKAYDNGPDILDLSNIKAHLFDLADESTYKNLSDFITYNSSTKTWSCAKKVYIVSTNQASKDFIIPASRYQEYVDNYGKSSVTAAELEGTESDEDICANKNNTGEVNFGDKAEYNCNGILGPEMIDFLQMLLNWVRIIAPILVIVLTSIDFAGAMLKDDKDALTKATSKLVKRLIIAAALFFVPTIINFILDIYSDVRGIDVTTCL